MNFSGFFSNNTYITQKGEINLNSNFYQNPYSDFDIFNQSYQIKLNQKKSIKSHSKKTGLCIIIFLLAPYVAGAFLALTGTFGLYEQNLTFGYVIELLLNVVFLFLPFLCVYFMSNENDKREIAFSLEKPTSLLLSISAIFFGLMLCFLGDYISTLISVVFEKIGITLTSIPEQTIPTSGKELFLFAFATIVPPAIIEEFALRAVTMQPLRKYGEVFAIISTAIVFGLMHRNAVQGIFAFIAGLVFGFITVSTNSVWIAVIIHALNNSFAVMTSVLNEIDTDLANKVYFTVVPIVFVLGIISAVPFFMSSKRISLSKKPTLLTAKEKTSSFFLTLPMILSILVMVFYTIFGET